MTESQSAERELHLLGRAIREIRNQQHTSAQRLADTSGIKVAQIRELEAGQIDPDYEQLLLLARALGVRPSAFVLRAEELHADDLSQR